MPLTRELLEVSYNSSVDCCHLRVSPSQAKITNRVGKGSGVYLAAVLEVGVEPQIHEFY